MGGKLVPKVNKESSPLRGDIGLLIYFILTNKIFFRILLIFIIGWLMRFGINTLWTVNYLDPFDLIAIMYYFFMGCLATFSEVYGMLNNLPSIFELYNSIYNGVRLFNFDQYIKAKIPTVYIKPYINCDNNNPTLGNSTLTEPSSPNSTGSNKDPKIIRHEMGKLGNFALESKYSYNSDRLSKLVYYYQYGIAKGKIQLNNNKTPVLTALYSEFGPKLKALSLEYKDPKSITDEIRDKAINDIVKCDMLLDSIPQKYRIQTEYGKPVYPPQFRQD